MKTNMNSHDRIMYAINHQEPDHVPLYFLFYNYGDMYDRRSNFSFGNQWRYDARREFSGKNYIKRVEETLKLGLDDTLRIEPPLGMAEGYIAEGVKNIKTKVEKYYSEDKSEEIIEKTYITPEGNLKVIVKKPEHWPHGDNIILFSDFNVPVTKKFLTETYDDLKSLKYLLGQPRNEEYRKFKEEAFELRKAAKRLGVVLEGGWTALGDSLVWLLGILGMIMAQYDKPDFITEILELLCEWEEKRVEIIINEGIEILGHSAWYEITDFWTPDLYRKILKPKNSRLIQMAKQADVKFTYIVTKSIKELLDDYIEMGIDSIMGVDPVQGDADLKALGEKIGSKICLWGGINSAITLGKDSNEEDINKAVEDAIKYLAPGGGFVLYPVDVISADANPWDNIEIMLKKWKEIGSYPINL